MEKALTLLKQIKPNPNMALDSELNRAIKNNQPLSAILLTVTPSRIMGEHTINAILKSLKKAIKNYHLVFQFEQDKYLLILPETTHSQAVTLGKRITKTVGKLIPTATLSIGISNYHSPERNAVEVNLDARARLRPLKKAI